MADSRKPSFLDWIRQRGVRAAGRVPHSSLRLAAAAKWIASDGCWPFRCRTIDRMIAHLDRHAEAPTELALRTLFDLYRAFLASGEGLDRAVRGPMVHRGYLIPKATEEQIKELKDSRTARQAQTVTLGDVIAAEIGKAHRREVGLKKPPASC